MMMSLSIKEQIKRRRRKKKGRIRRRTKKTTTKKIYQIRLRNWQSLLTNQRKRRDLSASREKLKLAMMKPKQVLNQKSAGERRSKMMVAKHHKRKPQEKEEERARLIKKRRRTNKKNNKIKVPRKICNNRNKKIYHHLQDLILLNHLPKMSKPRTFSQTNKNKMINQKQEKRFSRKKVRTKIKRLSQNQKQESRSTSKQKTKQKMIMERFQWKYKNQVEMREKQTLLHNKKIKYQWLKANMERRKKEISKNKEKKMMKKV